MFLKNCICPAELTECLGNLCMFASCSDKYMLWMLTHEHNRMIHQTQTMIGKLQVTSQEKTSVDLFLSFCACVCARLGLILSYIQASLEMFIVFINVY